MLLMLNVCRIADAVALPGACLRTEAAFKGFVILQKQVTKYAKSGDISTKTEEKQFYLANNGHKTDPPYENGALLSLLR